MPEYTVPAPAARRPQVRISLDVRVSLTACCSCTCIRIHIHILYLEQYSVSTVACLNILCQHPQPADPKYICVCILLCTPWSSPPPVPCPHRGRYRCRSAPHRPYGAMHSALPRPSSAPLPETRDPGIHGFRGLHPGITSFGTLRCSKTPRIGINSPKRGLKRGTPPGRPHFGHPQMLQNP